MEVLDKKEKAEKQNIKKIQLETIKISDKKLNSFQDTSQSDTSKPNVDEALNELLSECSCLCVSLFQVKGDRLKLLGSVNSILSEDKRQSLQLLIGNSVQINNHSLVGSSAHNKCAYKISDVYNIGLESDILFNPVVDRMLDFRCKSMITYPIVNKEDEVVAIVQLINHINKSDQGNVNNENQNDLANDFSSDDLSLVKRFAACYLESIEASSLRDGSQKFLKDSAA
jgi:hypothetical protein